ncbi:MAG: phenylalanine--tRNA ligase subunit alpha [Gemmatimonadetes bacterium]|jgi:phenylalanyl-tRNA synthetase alpha chain|nr:phenylalanine--tRNA ligase subunit alpha [Gemmatimonadota bacterium]MDE0962046.1 phenylalanine--tRNA ligase subunit alpha [Candidatus Latescibacterota bacterium]MBT5326425.1 phenylalanine--tRNA ligase subunit alpha [Gemmatimonadota bacterium]MBT5451317.1 phenylalanine--tRNA ligase subunit alpha [Gemmatimonadota bacterium]MBT5800508.1 phenylalanine--tRNA ligase subunit alpha [Gemmatimonadota bacterium]|tara:strand:+ start:775 stop:1788 length:1014 start_codon:yes stop_codon:yes gene_type:complete
MLDEVQQIESKAVAEIQAAQDEKTLEELRIRHLGRKSPLRLVMGQIGQLPATERPASGQIAGQAQKAIQQAFDDKEMALRQAADAGSALDVTLPGRRPLLGRAHPLAQLTDELVNVFQGMGFDIADGPEAEDEYHNFDALNTPDDHPARDSHDTFYLEDTGLLRTQTSTVQIRVMEKMPPPIRIISPGRCYRKETVDATHHFAFHQIEGLYVDRGVSFADLKGTIEAMGRQVLGEDTKVRFRPHFFPFTEPSVEYDFTCSICHGENATCSICKGTGWIEIAGAGMVDPAVFENVGYDPEEFTGFAFGMGLERIAMIRHGIDDIRLFLENDLRFTRQF